MPQTAFMTWTSNIRALKGSSVPTAASSEDWRPRSGRRPVHPPMPEEVPGAPSLAPAAVLNHHLPVEVMLRPAILQCQNRTPLAQQPLCRTWGVSGHVQPLRYQPAVKPSRWACSVMDVLLGKRATPAACLSRRGNGIGVLPCSLSSLHPAQHCSRPSRREMSEFWDHPVHDGLQERLIRVVPQQVPRPAAHRRSAAKPVVDHESRKLHSQTRLSVDRFFLDHNSSSTS